MAWDAQTAHALYGGVSLEVNMRRFAFIALLLTTAISDAAEKEYTGVFSNEAEEFETVTLMIHDGGLAFFSAGVSGQIGEWDFDKHSLTLSIKLTSACSRSITRSREN